MTLATHEFIRRFLLHALPPGFHRIQHYGLLASSARKASIARARELLGQTPPPESIEEAEPADRLTSCPCCGGRISIINTFKRWRQPRGAPRRDPARPTLTPRRNNLVPANAPLRAPRQDQGESKGYIPHRSAD